jgi:DNA-binding NarL/FixJ family response regulator
MILKNPTNIIIVDDHPFIIKGYKNVLKAYRPTRFVHTVAEGKDCESAYKIITNPEGPDLDVAFLDISMPAYPEQGLYSGIDLAKLIQKTHPICKIILLTMHNEILEIVNVLETVNPHGLIIKNDLTFDSLLECFDRVIKDNVYYSQSIVAFLSKPKFENNGIDMFDKQILFQLSKGTKIKMLPEFIPLTALAIDRRRQGMKKLLEIADGTDSSLLVVAKERGLI